MFHTFFFSFVIIVIVVVVTRMFLFTIKTRKATVVQLLASLSADLVIIGSFPHGGGVEKIELGSQIHPA